MSAGYATLEKSGALTARRQLTWGLAASFSILLLDTQSATSDSHYDRRTTEPERAVSAG
jgi:hypothetical protein